MMLRKSGNELNGLFAMFEGDDVNMFNDNHTMVFNRTVGDWASERVMLDEERDHHWKTLVNAPKKSNAKKSKKSKKNFNSAKLANNPKPANETIVHKPHEGVCTEQNCWFCRKGFASKTIVYKPHKGVCAKEECFCHEKHIELPKFKPSKGQPEDWDLEIMLESGFTDAHYQLSFETDDEDESSAEDWDAEVDYTPGHFTPEEEREMLESGFTSGHYQMNFDTEDEDSTKPTPVEEGVSHHDSENWYLKKIVISALSEQQLSKLANTIPVEEWNEGLSQHNSNEDWDQEESVVFWYNAAKRTWFWN